MKVDLQLAWTCEQCGGTISVGAQGEAPSQTATSSFAAHIARIAWRGRRAATAAHIASQCKGRAALLVAGGFDDDDAEHTVDASQAPAPGHYAGRPCPACGALEILGKPTCRCLQ